jgi:hypothetical protein
MSEQEIHELSSTRPLRALVSAIDAYLAGLSGPGIAEVRAGIADAVDLPARLFPAQDHPCLKHLPAALGIVRANGHAALADAIEAARPHLRWIPYDLYDRAKIGERFADGHTFASILGEWAPMEHKGFELGLFLIAPDLLYRDHKHAAAELYAPLTGPHGFRFASGAALDWLPANTPVWNEPFRHHAIKTGDVPFLCIFAWTSDIDQPAVVIPEPDWAELEAAVPPRPI